MFWKAVSFSLAFCITLASLGNAQTLTLTLSPTLENTLVQSSAGTLSNALGDLYVGRTNQDGSGTAVTSIRRGLIEFNVAGSSVPSDAMITGGTLTMTDVTSGTTGSQTLSLYDVSKAWGQGTSYANGTGTAATNGDATWLYTSYDAADSTASPAWTNPGGDFSGTLSGSTIDSTNGQMVIWSSASNPQMTADIQNWLDDPSANFGWLLQGNESTGNTAKALGAGPHYAGTKPMLTISYEVVPEPSTAWLAISGLFAMAVVKLRRLGKRDEG